MNTSLQVSWIGTELLIWNEEMQFQFWEETEINTTKIYFSKNISNWTVTNSYSVNCSKMYSPIFFFLRDQYKYIYIIFFLKSLIWIFLIHLRPLHFFPLIVHLADALVSRTAILLNQHFISSLAALHSIKATSQTPHRTQQFRDGQEAGRGHSQGS